MKAEKFSNDPFEKIGPPIDVMNIDQEESQVTSSSILLVKSPQGDYYLTTKKNYDQIRLEDPGQLANTQVYSRSTVTHFNEDGLVSDKGFIPTAIFESRVSLAVQEDFFTGIPISIRDSNVIEAPEEKSVEDITGLVLSYNDINLIRVNPLLYTNKITPVKTQNEIINELLYLSIQNPGGIVEQFTVIPKEPWSDTMKEYLSILAELVSEQMDLSDEIDNFDELKAQAHKKAGCRENLETVTAKAEEYNEYFRYLLIKDEKHCVTNEFVDSVGELSASIKSYCPGFFSLGSGKDKLYYRKSITKPGKPNLIGAPDMIKITNGNKTITVVSLVYTPGNLEDFPDTIEKLGLHTKAAIETELCYYEFKNLFDKRMNLVYKFLVVDKNSLSYMFEVKSSTLNKWKKKLEDNVTKVLWHVENNIYTLPYEFLNGVATI